MNNINLINQLSDEQLLHIDAIDDLKKYLAKRLGKQVENFSLLQEGISRLLGENLYRIILQDENGILYPIDCWYNKTDNFFQNIRCDLRKILE